MPTQEQSMDEAQTEESAIREPVVMDAVVIEDSELYELYSGPRQDVTH